VKVEEGFYNDVMINRTSLNLLEARAKLAKSPAAFLLNKILDFVFTDEELRMSRGVKGLDEHRLNAIRGKFSTYIWEQMGNLLKCYYISVRITYVGILSLK
jgi:hypothetical protein